MKKLSWQQWTAIGIIAAIILTAIVLHLVQPQVSFAFTEIAGLATFAIGVLTGYFIGKKKTPQEKQLLLD